MPEWVAPWPITDPFLAGDGGGVLRPGAVSPLSTTSVILSAKICSLRLVPETLAHSHHP